MVLFSNAIGRSFFHFALVWSQEVASIALLAVAFIGGTAAYRRNEHMAVRILLDHLGRRSHDVLTATVAWIILETGMVMAWQSFQLAASGLTSKTPVLGLPGIVLVLPFTFGMIMLVVYAAEAVSRHRVSVIIATGLGTMAVVGIAVLSYSLWQAWASLHAVSISLALFAVLLAIGVPIGFVLADVAVVFLTFSSAATIVAVPSDMLDGVNNFLLLSIPFFIFAGLIMTEGGLSRPLANFVRALVGWLPGGLLQVVVVTMYLFSGISGSKAADVAAVGTTMNPILKREGYSVPETASVLAASAVMGETVPPSLGMLVLASVTSVSVAALFAAGLLPAAVIGIAVMLTIYVRATRAKMPTSAGSSLKQIVRYFVEALPALVLPIFLIAGIITGLATPTEISAFAVVYALLLVAVYRSLSWRGFFKLLSDTATASGMVLFIISAAIAFSRALAVARLPQQIVAALHALPGGWSWFLIATVILLIVMGAVLEGLPALLIFAPLLMPVATQLDINPVHYGLILILAMGLGSFSPPIGVGLYVTCSICRVSMERVSIAFAPYLAMLVVGIIAIAFLPQVTLAVPRALNLIR